MLGYASLLLYGILMLGLIISHSSSTNNVKFPKDQSIDKPFPVNVILPSSPGLPIGHLRPLGHHRRSDGPVCNVSLQSWDQSTPGLLKGFMANSSRLWPKDTSDQETERLKKPVLVTKRRTSGLATYERMTLEEFYEDFSSEEWILDQLLPPELINKIEMPSPFAGLADKLFSVAGCMSSGATSDLVQFSTTMDMLQCALHGRRDYIIMEAPSSVLQGDSKPMAPCNIHKTANLDPDLVNIFDNPWLSTLPWKHASLFSGDCIIIPHGFLYHTNSYGDAEVLSFYWHKEVRYNSSVQSESSHVTVRPLVCSVDDKQNIELCDQQDVDSVDTWRQLLLNVTNADGVLEKSCFASVIKKKENADKLYAMIGSQPVSRQVIEELPHDTLSSIKAQCDGVEASHHIHDEL